MQALLNRVIQRFGALLPPSAAPERRIVALPSDAYLNAAEIELDSAAQTQRWRRDTGLRLVVLENELRTGGISESIYLRERVALLGDAPDLEVASVRFMEESRHYHGALQMREIGAPIEAFARGSEIFFEEHVDPQIVASELIASLASSAYRAWLEEAGGDTQAFDDAMNERFALQVADPLGPKTALSPGGRILERYVLLLGGPDVLERFYFAGDAAPLARALDAARLKPSEFFDSFAAEVRKASL